MEQTQRKPYTWLEQFNAIIAKLCINYCKKRSYKSRCAAAVVSFNTKRPMYEAYKQLVGRSPGAFAKRIEMRNKQRILKRRHNETKFAQKGSLLFYHLKKTKDYGTYCNKPDMSPEEYNIAQDVYLKDIRLTEDEIRNIEQNTRVQRKSDLWFSERRKIVTASKFYDVCSKLPYTSRASLVQSIIRPKHFSAAATEYGVTHEEEAIRTLSQAVGKKN
ncbi:hypothetical protein RN001_014484 [Aquatica leii]|uniref:Uncharacterized protein n=1 Tax=Aquatica leii TaxID=1421715 RepID=A0AAN7NUL0_9COLE|nr:hypothetical protein RN001_014484 [Aquatica leii]